MEDTLLGSISKSLWRLVGSLSMDADALFHEAGMDTPAADKPRARCNVESFRKAWRIASEQAGNPYIGLLAAEHYQPVDFHSLGISFLTSKNLTDALQRLSRYASVIGTDYRFTVECKNNRVVCTGGTEEKPMSSLNIIEDVQNAIFVHLCRTGIDGKLDPIEVTFTYPKPSNISEYLGFFRCELKFDQPEAGFSFAVEDSERLFVSANHEIASNSDSVMDKLLSDLDAETITSHVKKVIISRLPSGTPSDTEIADILHVSSRTLSRRLAKESTTFREVLAAVRRELAGEYISNPNIPITEISYLLGFSDLSSFSRAFKGWNGHSPKAFRDDLAKGVT